MHPVAYVDLATLLTLVTAAIALAYKRQKSSAHDPVGLLLFGFLFFSILYIASLSLEWILSSDFFDRIEDFLGSLYPMGWAFLFYAILQKISNLELTRSKDQYQLVVDNISESIIKLDGQKRIRFASPSFCELLEKSASELIGTGVVSINQAEDPILDIDFIDQTMIPPYTALHESLIHTKAGPRWFAWSAKCLPDTANGGNEIIVVGRDTTEKKKAHEALRESEARHRQFIENQPVGMFRTEFKEGGRFVMANPAMAKIFGFSSVEELMQTPAASLYKDPEQKRHILKKLVGEERISEFEVEGKRRDGSLRVGIMALRLVKDSQGNPWQVDGTVIDITEQKRAEKALQASELLHRKAQRVASLGHWEHDLENDTLACSDEIFRIFELDKNKFNGSPETFRDMVHPDDRKRLDGAVPDAVDNDPDINMSHRIVLPDKRIKYVHIIGQAEYDDNGKPVKLMGTVQDVTPLQEAEIEKEKAEQRLLQAQKLEAIGTLAGGIAHDFNNILTSIIGFTQLSIGEIPKEHKARERLEEVLLAGLRARDLVAHILTFSRQREQVFETVQVNTIIKEVIKLLRASIPANIEIRQDIAANCCPVLVDPIQIHQVIMNLFTNAYQAIGQKNGQISISLKTVEIGPNDFAGKSNLPFGPYAQIGVSDTGHGMDQATLQRIFEPYFTTKQRQEGTGLGLSVVHGIVTKHRGHITAYSEPGRGTSFWIYLPCAEAAHPVSQESVEEKNACGSGHILVIDDEQPITVMLTEMLNYLGYRVTAFFEAEKAIEFFQSRIDACDLVITDMAMPVISGTELSRRIHAINPHVPIIIQTGFSDQLNPEELKTIGVASIIRKPILLRELAICVKKVLDGPACER